MASRYSQGRYQLKFPEKYIGNKTPLYRSSWEFDVMLMLDNNPAINKWSSEGIRIPYKCPLTGKQTTYVPDFFVNYVGKNGKQHSELWEIKPANQAIKERVGRSKVNQAHYIRNLAKWEACRAFCKQNGLTFRVITESDLYVGTKR
jgi:hypothetical protein